MLVRLTACVATLLLAYALLQSPVVAQRQRPEREKRSEQGGKAASPEEAKQIEAVERAFRGEPRPSPPGESALPASVAVPVEPVRAPGGLQTGIQLETARTNRLYLEWAQQSLNSALGAALTVDGRSGPETTRRIREFQRANGLVPDGKLGPNTERRLAEQTHTSPPGRLDYLTDPRNGLSPGIRLLDGDSLDRLLAVSAPPGAPLYIDVQAVDGVMHVLASKGITGLTPGQRLDPGLQNVVSVETPDALLRLLEERQPLVSVGDSLPEQWESVVKDKGVPHVQVSDHSPKRTLAEHAAAARRLDTRLESGNIGLFSALPRGSERDVILDRLEALGLPLDQADAWREVDQDVAALEARSGHRIETLTKPGLLNELRVGTTEIVVLFAHSLDGSIRLPDGERVTPEEIAGIQRDQVASRTIVLISCGAGATNASDISIAEILLKNGLAGSVIAPPGLVNATEIPEMLRRLFNGETLNQSFNRRLPYRAVSRLQDKGRRNGSEERTL